MAARRNPLGLRPFYGLLLSLMASSCALFGREESKPIPPQTLEKIRIAAEAVRVGKFDDARTRIESLKALKPSSSLQEAIGSLEERLFSSETVAKMNAASDIEVDKELAVAGEALVVTIRLRNPTESPLTILGPRKSFLGGVDYVGLTGRLTSHSIAYDPYGNRVNDRNIQSFHLEDEIVISPGGEWTQETLMELAPLQSFAMRRYRLFCEMLPIQVRYQGKEATLEGLRIGPVIFRSFPPGFEALKADPLDSLEKALSREDKQFDVHLLICAILIPESSRKDAVRLIAQALPAEMETRRRALMSALGWLTGEEKFLTDDQSWTEWWEKNKSKYEEGGEEKPS